MWAAAAPHPPANLTRSSSPVACIRSVGERPGGDAVAAGRECTRPASSTSPLPPPSVMAPSLSRCRFSPPRTRQESGGSGGDPNGGEITGGGPLLRPAQRHHSLATDVTSPATCHPGTAISANAAGASPAVMTAPLPPAFLNGGHGGGGGKDGGRSVPRMKPLAVGGGGGTLPPRAGTTPSRSA